MVSTPEGHNTLGICFHATSLEYSIIPQVGVAGSVVEINFILPDSIDTLEAQDRLPPLLNWTEPLTQEANHKSHDFTIFVCIIILVLLFFMLLL
jgi:hypothetical protein